MQKYLDINEQGLSVRCKLYYGTDARNISDIVIATYGFGGNKDNSATEKFAERMLSKNKKGGVLVFDWPYHGADARNKLTISECLTYFQMVIDYAKRELGAQRLYSYGTSFGGFINLIYLAENENPFERIALRCPAVKMYDIMAVRITDEERTKLKKGKEIVRGYQRPIKLSQEFFDELGSYNVTSNEYFDVAEKMLIIAGNKDDFIALSDVEEFCDNNVIECVVIDKADHPFSDPRIMDLAISKIVDFFQNS